MSNSNSGANALCIVYHKQYSQRYTLRIPKGRDEGAWWHPLFLRGHPEKIQKIVRTKRKGEASSIPDVPNFHDMPPTLQTGGANNQHFNKCYLYKEVEDVVAPTLSTNEGGGICVDEGLESLQSWHDIPRHACMLPKKKCCAVETSPAKSMGLCHQPADVIAASFIPPMANIRAKPDFVPTIIHQGGHCASTEVEDTDDLDEFSKFIDNNVFHLPFDRNVQD